MQHTSHFYQVLHSILQKGGIDFHTDLTGISVKGITEKPVFDSVQSLLESDVYANMLEEIASTDSETTQYLRQQMVEHEGYYSYEAQEAEQTTVIDLFRLRQSYLMEHGIGALFLPKSSQNETTSLATYHQLVGRQLVVAQNEYEPHKECTEQQIEKSVEVFNQVLSEIQNVLSTFGLERENVTISPIREDHSYKGGFALVVTEGESHHSYVAYTPFENIWLKLSVISHELGHALYFSSLKSEAPEISLERPELWNECVAEAVSMYTAITLADRYPELYRMMKWRVQDAVAYSLRTLDVLIKEDIQESDVAEFDESLEGLISALYDPFRYYVSERIAEKIVERGHEWFTDMIHSTHSFQLDVLILDYWESYIKKFGSE